MSATRSIGLLLAAALTACPGDNDRGRDPKGDAEVDPESDPESGPPQSEAPPALDFEQTYLRWRTRFAEQPGFASTDAARGAAMVELRRVANEAEEPHLRANAALLLGAMHDERDEHELAANYYRHAAKLIPDDAGPLMALALALGRQDKFAEAAQVQGQATELDPDNLENWLALGELRLKAGDKDGATQAYVDYERRRKGLIDGLTLTKNGNYVVSIEQRVGCAEALASATDQGTAVALAYALRTDPEPSVRATVARVMGVQRLTWYREPLKQALAGDQASDVREAATWAMAEIDRDPVEVTKGDAPSRVEDEADTDDQNSDAPEG